MAVCTVGLSAPKLLNDDSDPDVYLRPARSRFFSQHFLFRQNDLKLGLEPVLLHFLSGSWTLEVFWVSA